MSFGEKRLTLPGRFGLMRPVARIAQSVEQGIENPRVPGSIPGSGTKIQRTRLWRVFAFVAIPITHPLFDSLQPLIQSMPTALLPKETARTVVAQRTQNANIDVAGYRYKSVDLQGSHRPSERPRV